MLHARLFIIVLLGAAVCLPGALAQDNGATSDDPAGRRDDAATRQYDFANGLYVRGEAFYGQAAEQYRNFLRDYPGDARCDEALFRLGECERKDGKLDEALKTFKDYARRFPNGTNAERATLRTGQALHELGRLDEAIAAFRAVMASQAPAEFKQAAGYRLGKALLDGGKTVEAIAVFNAIADDKRNRFRPFALYQLGLAHEARGEHDDAVTRFGQLAKLNADFAPEALFRLGEVEFKRDRYAEAAAAYGEVVAKHAKSPYAGAAAYGLVQSLVRAGEYEKAITAHERLTGLIPKPVKAQTDYLVANAHYELARYETALKLYEVAAQGAPKTELATKAEFRIAWCRYFLKDFETLVTAATRFLDEHPGYADADKVHYLAGESLLQLGRPQDAILHYETIIKDFPKSEVLVEAEFRLGWCLFLKAPDEVSLYDTARKQFIKFADTYPGDPRAAEALGRAAECALKLSRTDTAVEDYTRLLRDYPESPLAEGALYQLALAYVALDAQDKAVATFLQFVDEYPESASAPDALYWIGSEKQKAGELDEAVAYLKRSLEASTDEHFIERASHKLAIIHHGREQFDNAAAILLAMLKKNAKAGVPAKTHLWAAGYLLEQAQSDDATFLYQGFLAKFTKDAGREEAYVGLGQCLEHAGQWDKALAAYTKAIAADGARKLLARLRSAVCLHKLGKDSDALTELAELAALEKPAIASEAHYWRGTVLLQQAQEAAQEAAQKAKDDGKARDLYDSARLHFLRVVILYENAERRAECMFQTAQCLTATGETGEAEKQYRQLIDAHPASTFASQARKTLGIPEPEDEAEADTEPPAGG